MRALWLLCGFFFKQKTAYEMRISDWSSDVCSSDLPSGADRFQQPFEQAAAVGAAVGGLDPAFGMRHHAEDIAGRIEDAGDVARRAVDVGGIAEGDAAFAFEPVERIGIGEIIAVMMRRSEEHTAELQSLMRTSYAVFC